MEGEWTTYFCFSDCTTVNLFKRGRGLRNKPGAADPETPFFSSAADFLHTLDQVTSPPSALVCLRATQQ